MEINKRDMNEVGPEEDRDARAVLSKEDQELFEETFTPDFMAKLDRICQAARN